MKACAETLLHFRGKNVIQRYVFTAIQQLDAFAAPTAKQTAADKRNEETGDDAYASIDATAAGSSDKSSDSSTVLSFRASLSRYYKGVLSTIRHQCELCAAVFPQPLSIMKALLDRVFGDKVQTFIDNALSGAQLPTNDHLRMLHIAHQQTEALVKHMQDMLRDMLADTNTAAGATGKQNLHSGSSSSGSSSVSSSE